MNILISSTSLALWHDIIHEAESACSVALEEEVESYLVFLMMRYLTRPEIANQIMANEFLSGMQLAAMQRELVLQRVGDKCLLFSGLFPKLVEKRSVKIGYFVNLGRSAYGMLAKNQHDVYKILSKQFVTLMDVLQSIRHYTKDCTDLLPLQAYELWNETGSQRALAVLSRYTSSPPISTLTNGRELDLFK
jgi:hypothetical protein